MKVLKRKSLVLLMVFSLLAMVALSACSKAKSDVLRVGVDDVYPPMEYRDEKNTAVGFDIDLATEIGKKLGMKVEFVSTAWSGIFTALESEKFDCIISSLSITDKRKETIAFTNPYISNAQVIVVSPSNTSIKTEKDLKDKIVGVQEGTTAEEAGSEFTKDTPFKDFKKYPEVIQPFQELKTGRIEAIIVDEVVAKYYLAKDKSSYKLAGVRLDEEPIGIGCKKSNTDLRDKIQKALDDLRADGTLKNISEKWFGEDLVSNVK